MKKNLTLTHRSTHQAARQAIILFTLLLSCASSHIHAAMVEIGGQKLSPNDYLGPILNTTYQQKIQTTLQDTSMQMQQKIMQMQTIATNILNDAQKNGINTMPADLQDTYAQALVTLFESSKAADASAETINSMKSLLTEAQNSPLLRSEQQTYVQNEMLAKLPQVAVAQAAVTMDDITAALQAKSFVAKINALSVLIDKGQGQTFDHTTQDAFGKALITLFNVRAKQKSAALNKFVALLTNAQTTTLLAPNQQQYVTEQMLPQVSQQAQAKKQPKAKQRRRGQMRGQAASGMPTQQKGVMLQR